MTIVTKAHPFLWLKNMNESTRSPTTEYLKALFIGRLLRNLLNHLRSDAKESGNRKTYRDERGQFVLEWHCGASSRSLRRQQGTKKTTGPPVAICHQTTYDPNRVIVSFVCFGLNGLCGVRGGVSVENSSGGPFRDFIVPCDRISPGVLKESSSVRHIAGVRGRSDCTSPGRLRVPSQQHNTDAINKAPKLDRHSPARNAVEGVRGPVCLVSGRVLPGSRAGRAGYAAGEMCLPIFLGAINNIPAMNSQRGGGNRAAAGQRVLPDTGTGRAGQQRHFSCAQRKFLGGRLVGDLGRWFPGVQVLSNDFGPAVVVGLQRFSAGRFRKTLLPLSWFDGSFPTRATVGSGGRCLFFYPRNKQFWLKRTPINVGPLKGWERRPVRHTGGIFGTVSSSLCPRLWVLPGVVFWSVFHARNNFFAHNRQLLESNSNSKQAPAFGSFVRGLEFFTIPDSDPGRHSQQTRGYVVSRNVLT